MEESTAELIQNIMTFNPFKATSSHKKGVPLYHHDRNLSLDNDSWHSQQPQSAPSSGPLSWFSSGWTPSSITLPPPSSRSMPISADNSIRQANVSTSSVMHPPIAPVQAPAEAMIMVRATHSEESVINLHQQVAQYSAVSEDNIMEHTTSNDSAITSNESNNDIADRFYNKISDEKGFSLPPYPQARIHTHPITENEERANNNDKLLVEFPSPTTNRSQIDEFLSKQQIQNKTEKDATCNAAAADVAAAARKRIINCARESEETYPGFALYQAAKFQYYLGKYSEALDTTTECLALQKLALGCSSGGESPAQTAHASSTDDGKGIINGMAALDLRSKFVSGVGRSMRGVVQSLTTSSTTITGNGAGKVQQKPQSHPSPPRHPMLSNSMASLIAQYPLHPCIAQTLLLRGRVLADCGLYGLRDDGTDDDDVNSGYNVDFSLLLQAIRNVEISVGILRKIDLEYDLATSLVLLGTLRTLLCHYDEADRAYEEALSIFRDLRIAARYDQSLVMDKETTAMYDQSMKRINGATANVLFFRGKLFQSLRMHKEAFRCYRKSLFLYECNGANRQNGCVRRIAKCMKSRSALEKLVSAYIDDRAGV